MDEEPVPAEADLPHEVLDDRDNAVDESDSSEDDEDDSVESDSSEDDEDDSVESDSSEDDEDDDLALLNAQFPTAAVDAQQAVHRQLLRGGLAEQLLNTMDESRLEFFRENGVTLNIPVELLDELMTRPETWRLRTPRYLPLVLTSGTRKLVICCGERRAMTRGWSVQDLDQLVQLIITTCKNSLVSLTIHNDNGEYEDPSRPNLSTEQLHILLNSISCLDQLHVGNITESSNKSRPSTIVTDTTLDIIAEKHKKIRAIPFPTSATLAGLHRVLEHCKDLQHISIDNSEGEACRTAILQAPNLKSIGFCPVRCVREIALERNPEEPPFLLRGETTVVGTVEEFKQVLKVFPNLSFRFCEEDLRDPGYYEALVEQRMKLSYLSVFEQGGPLPLLAELIQHFSSSLTSMFFSDEDAALVVDLALIGYFCTNLKDLYVGSRMGADPEYTNMLEARHFGALEVLRISAPEPQLLPDRVLVRMLGGERLRFLELWLLSVPNSVAVSLEEEAKADGKALGSLQVLYINRRQLDNATLRIVINAPKLELFQINIDLPPYIEAFLAPKKPNLRVVEYSGDPPFNPSYLWS